jgi:hypothetical protein
MSDRKEPKKGCPCPCESGKLYGRCCGKARSRKSSPEGAVELLLTLASGDRSYTKTELCERLKLTSYNVDSFLEWASGQKPPLAHKILREGWPLIQGDAAAIRAFIQRFQSHA